MFYILGCFRQFDADLGITVIAENTPHNGENCSEDQVINELLCMYMCICIRRHTFIVQLYCAVSIAEK